MFCASVEITVISGISCVYNCRSRFLVLPAKEYRGRDKRKGDSMNSSRMLSLILICLAFSSSCFAQTSPFDLAEYQQFLEQHRNMTSSELLQMCPAEDFKEDVNVPWESVVHHDLIETAYTLTDYERSSLRKHGFVVTERLRKDSFIDQL